MDSHIRDHVSRSISDDYESVELIRDSVQGLAGLEATTEHVCQALSDLVEGGLAQAYELSPEHPQATAVNIDPDRIEELWFYATPQGIVRICEINNRELTTEN